jgi:hypothetical protein
VPECPSSIRHRNSEKQRVVKEQEDKCDITDHIIFTEASGPATFLRLRLLSRKRISLSWADIATGDIIAFTPIIPLEPLCAVQQESGGGHDPPSFVVRSLTQARAKQIHEQSIACQRLLANHPRGFMSKARSDVSGVVEIITTNTNTAERESIKKYWNWRTVQSLTILPE